MTIDYKKLRLDGIYQQDKQGNLMLRIKIPAGLLSSAQAEAVSAISEEFSNGMLHLTCRGSIELHWLKLDDLDQVFRRLAGVGLTSRGACGGAVRGISCSTTASVGFPYVQSVAQRLHRHFAGNPYFEGLPKKFKVGIDADYAGARHLIQDVGLVLVNSDDGPRFDVWTAGGLGRKPQAGFLLEQGVAEEELIPLIESIVQVYRDNTPPPKRLKFLLNEIGEERFRALLAEERAKRPTPAAQASISTSRITSAESLLEVPVFAGELPASHLRHLAAAARVHAEGCLAVTADQNMVLPLSLGEDPAGVRKQLADLGVPFSKLEQQVTFRVCPGNHECSMGLSATREVARSVIQKVTEADGLSRGLTWAISGCPNSCSQPQLATIGIVTSKRIKNPQGEHEPRFDLYRREQAGLGERVTEALDLGALLEEIGQQGR